MDAFQEKENHRLGVHPRLQSRDTEQEFQLFTEELLRMKRKQ